MKTWFLSKLLHEIFFLNQKCTWKADFGQTKHSNKIPLKKNPRKQQIWQFSRRKTSDPLKKRGCFWKTNSPNPGFYSGCVGAGHAKNELLQPSKGQDWTLCIVQNFALACCFHARPSSTNRNQRTIGIPREHVCMFPARSFCEDTQLFLATAQSDKWVRWWIQVLVTGT